MNTKIIKQISMIALASLPLYTAGCAAGDEDADEPVVGDEFVDAEESAARKAIFSKSLTKPIIDVVKVEIKKTGDDDVELRGYTKNKTVALKATVKVGPGPVDEGTKIISVEVSDDGAREYNGFFVVNGQLSTADGMKFDTSGMERFPGVLSFLRGDKDAKAGCAGIMTAGLASAVECSTSLKSKNCKSWASNLSNRIKTCK